MENVRQLINSLDNRRCLDILKNVSDNNEEKILTFLEVCISMRYRQLRTYTYKYFPHFSIKEICCFFEVLDKEFINEAYIFCNSIPMQDIIPTFNELKLREIIPSLSEDVLFESIY